MKADLEFVKRKLAASTYGAFILADTEMGDIGVFRSITETDVALEVFEGLDLLPLGDVEYLMALHNEAPNMIAEIEALRETVRSFTGDEPNRNGDDDGPNTAPNE